MGDESGQLYAPVALLPVCTFWKSGGLTPYVSVVCTVSWSLYQLSYHHTGACCGLELQTLSLQCHHMSSQTSLSAPPPGCG